MGTYCLNVDAVKESISDLRGRSLHPSLAGYLCIKLELRRSPKGASVSPSFKKFFDNFLAVPGGPAPYLVPFKETGSPESSPWFNANVAGSYAPSSIRDTSRILKVCSLDRASKRFSLLNGHAGLALQHLAASQKIPVLSLATFLYRDFSFEAPELPRAELLIAEFREEFGYRENVTREAAEFSALFSEAGHSTMPLFQEI